MLPDRAEENAPRLADVVLEGGGVRGVALVGAIDELGARGYGFARVAGTSAGAIVGAVLAAMVHRGEPLTRLDEITRSLDYRALRDRRRPLRWLDRIPGPFEYLADALAVARREGAYSGDRLRTWLHGVLADLGVRTFGDLRFDDPEGDTARDHYRLVVSVSDVSRRLFVRLPWDYADYGLDPDEQSVAAAVHASAATPYLFEPVELRGAHGVSTLVDGGLVANFPIGIFDRLDGRSPRWPTIGIRLQAEVPTDQRVAAVGDPVHLGIALIETAVEGAQTTRALDPYNLARTIGIDTRGVDSFDFDITPEQRDQLIAHGREAARAFLVEHPAGVVSARPAVAPWPGPPDSDGR